MSTDSNPKSGSGRSVMDVPVHDFIENDRGEMLLVLDGQPEAPVEPRLILSGHRDEAMLHRGSGLPMHLSRIMPEALERLRKLDNVMIAEMGSDDVLHSYTATVSQTDA
jgi:hypothetical protein